MSAGNSYTIKIDDIPIKVTRKRVKHLRIVAYPSSKSVRISSPMHVKDAEIREFAESRAGWIKKHFENVPSTDRKTGEEYTNGSTHYLWGEPFELQVDERAKQFSVARVDSTTVKLCVKPGSDQSVRERVMREWYRRELKRPIPKLIKKWEPVMKVSVKEWNVKKMKTRWGTCNTRAGRIWISLHLVKMAPEFLEYILVHEMTHLLERGHTRRFYRLMDGFHPGWREIDKSLGGKHWRKRSC
jgi:predicted metal-dependent hydrolase